MQSRPEEIEGRQAGAWGGKLLGAGGGGLLLVFAPPDRHPALERVFADHPTLSVRINPSGSEIIYASDFSSSDS